MTPTTDTTNLVFMLDENVLEGVNVSTFTVDSHVLCGQDVSHGWGTVQGAPVARLHLTREDGWWLLAGALTPFGARTLRGWLGDHFSHARWVVRPVVQSGNLVCFELTPWVPNT